MEATDKYAIVVMPLSKEQGGGYVARVPDLPGCFGDGETREEAVADAQAAILEWVEEYSRIGRSIPEPGSLAAEFRKPGDSAARPETERFPPLPGPRAEGLARAVE